MKRFALFCIIMIVLGLCCQSCTKVSHNANLVGVGKVFKVGAGDYGITYVNGLVAIEGVRENSEMVVESNDGDSFANPASAVKSLRTIRFRTGPQVTGYLVDLSKKSEEAAKTYVEKMPDLNKSAWDVKLTKNTDATALKSEAIQKAKETVEDAMAIAEPFTCSGDCDLQGLDKISSRIYQEAVARKLLTYADDTTKIHDSDATVKATLKQFLARMQQYADKGISSVGLRVRSASIKSNILQDVTYVYFEGADETETNCPECIVITELID